MNNAEKYFEQQKQNTKFTQSYNEITQQVDIEWELERVKKHIEANYAKKNNSPRDRKIAKLHT